MQAIDDFPSVSVSRLRASGAILPHDRSVTVIFPTPDAPSFTLPVVHRRFRNGGGWSFFLCSCGRRARIIRLAPTPVCRCCLLARGFQFRIKKLGRSDAAAHTASRLAARLASPPARFNPRPGRRLDRRPRLEAALLRAEYVEARGLGAP
jgi:hypothetical protein